MIARGRPPATLLPQTRKRKAEAKLMEYSDEKSGWARLPRSRATRLSARPFILRSPQPPPPRRPSRLTRPSRPRPRRRSSGS